jgi:hypothetical protein
MKTAPKVLISKKEKRKSSMKLNLMLQRKQRLKPLQAVTFLYQEALQFKAISQILKRDQKSPILLILMMKDLLRKSEKSEKKNY